MLHRVLGFRVLGFPVLGHKGTEPSTLFGGAITEIVTPRHVFDLPAEPAAR